MANDETAFREVDQALAEDQQWEFFRKHGAILIGSAAAVILGVAGLQFYSASKGAAANKAAIAYKQAGDLLTEDPGAGTAAMAEFAQTAPDGYGALAQMSRAGVLAATGETQEALAVYRQLYQGAAPRRIKELARLRAAVLAMAEGRDAVLADLGNLTEASSAFGFHARELAALAALEAKDYETAYSMFTAAAADPATPDPVRERATEFAALAFSAKSGVNITGDVQADDLLKALGDRPVEESHEGHDHGSDDESAAEDEAVSPENQQE